MKKKLFAMLFLTFILMSCTNKNENNNFKLNVLCPQGAPAMGIAKTYSTYSNVNTTLVNGTAEIKSSFLTSSYDVVIAPSNLGAQIYNANESYQMFAGLSFGNIYFASTTQILSIGDLNNKEIVLFGKGSINDLVANYVLNYNNITSSISYMDSASDTKTAFVTNENPEKVYLLAEPTMSAASIALKSKNIESYNLSVTSLWNEATKLEGFMQASIFVKKETYILHKEVVDNYVEDVKESVNYLNDLTNLDTTISYLSNVNVNITAKVAKTAIPNSNIKYVDAKYAKEMFEKTYKLNLALVGGKLPNDGFYKE